MLFRSLTALIGLATATPSLAQNGRTFPACPSRQKIEEGTGSQGRFVLADSRHLKITRVKSGSARFGVLDFRSGADPGILDKITDAALTNSVVGGLRQLRSTIA